MMNGVRNRAFNVIFAVLLFVGSAIIPLAHAAGHGLLSRDGCNATTARDAGTAHPGDTPPLGHVPTHCPICSLANMPVQVAVTTTCTVILGNVVGRAVLPAAVPAPPRRDASCRARAPPVA